MKDFMSVTLTLKRRVWRLTIMEMARSKMSEGAGLFVRTFYSKDVLIRANLIIPCSSAVFAFFPEEQLKLWPTGTFKRKPKNYTCAENGCTSTVICDVPCFFICVCWRYSKTQQSLIVLVQVNQSVTAPVNMQCNSSLD